MQLHEELYKENPQMTKEKYDRCLKKCIIITAQQYKVSVMMHILKNCTQFTIRI